jgi:hypothetical protein
MGLLDWWRDRSREFSLFPRDENGDVLWGMHRNGDDLTKERKMDFFFIFPNKDLAQRFCERAKQYGFHTSLSYFEEKHAWDAECSVNLIPTHARVTSVESQLSHLPQQFGGKADGWGALSQE